MIRAFFRANLRASRAIDRVLFGAFSVDGNGAFCEYVRTAVTDGASLADIGAGKTPFFSPEEKSARRLVVQGVDIDPDELSRAPAGSYDEVIVGPIETVRGREDADFVVAQSVLEHVQDGRLAAAGLASFARPGAKVITFCPNRRAWFARLNRLLPEGIKRGVLFYVFPEKRERQGFPAPYSGCTPDEMIANMRAAGVAPVEIRPYFVSSYFMFFVPLYLFWRLVTFPGMRLMPLRYCETFVFLGERREPAP